MSGKSKSRGQTKCSPRSSKLGFGRGAKDPTPEVFNVNETTKEAKIQAGLQRQ
jgi:hypothetical protein